MYFEKIEVLPRLILVQCPWFKESSVALLRTMSIAINCDQKIE